MHFATYYRCTMSNMLPDFYTHAYTHGHTDTHTHRGRHI